MTKIKKNFIGIFTMAALFASATVLLLQSIPML